LVAAARRWEMNVDVPLLHHDAVDRAASTDPFAFRLLGFGIACVIASARSFLT